MVSNIAKPTLPLRKVAHHATGQDAERGREPPREAPIWVGARADQSARFRPRIAAKTHGANPGLRRDRLPGSQFPRGWQVTLAVGGALLPTMVVHGDAERRRRSFKHALGAYLDLVSINLAAGRGVETALDRAARSGQGWMFAGIRQALYRAKVNQPSLLTSQNERSCCSQAFSS
jgi:hypothetical protein